MSTTIAAAERSTAPASRGVAPAPLDPVVVKRRRPNMTRLLGFVVLMVVAGLAAVWVVNSVTAQNQVVMVTRPIAAGETITADDVIEQTLGTIPAGVSTISADQLSTLVGQQALVDLPKGSLLAAGSVGEEPQPVAGRTLIGLRLEQGRTIPDAQPGDRVRLVVTNPPTSGADGTREETKPGDKVTYPGIVVKTSAALDGAAVIMTVDVATQTSTEVAIFAADNRISVVQEAR